MYVLRGLPRLGLLLLAAAALCFAALPGAASAQREQPQCSDGVDNDGDRAIDGADAGCGDGSDADETDSAYAGVVLVTIPLPVVTIQGTVDVKGNVKLSRVEVRALRGSSVDIRCKGRKCPFKRSRRVMITSKLRLGQLERGLRGPMTLTLRIARPGQLGKYLRYQIRRNKPPKRFDACIDQNTRKVRPCFVG